MNNRRPIRIHSTGSLSNCDESPSSGAWRSLTGLAGRAHLRAANVPRCAFFGEGGVVLAEKLPVGDVACLALDRDPHRPIRPSATALDDYLTPRKAWKCRSYCRWKTRRATQVVSGKRRAGYRHPQGRGASRRRRRLPPDAGGRRAVLRQARGDGDRPARPRNSARRHSTGLRATSPAIPASITDLTTLAAATTSRSSGPRPERPRVGGDPA